MARDPIETVLGPKAAAIRELLERTHPDLARYVRDFAYGEVYARPGLGLRERELLAVACLTALNLKPQLKTHVFGALHVGVTRTELEETFLHLALYLGFPAALSGMMTAREVFDEVEQREAGHTATASDRASRRRVKKKRAP